MNEYIELVRVEGKYYDVRWLLSSLREWAEGTDPYPYPS